MCDIIIGGGSGEGVGEGLMQAMLMEILATVYLLRCSCRNHKVSHQ